MSLLKESVAASARRGFGAVAGLGEADTLSAKVVGSGYAYFVLPGADGPLVDPDGDLHTKLTYHGLRVRRVWESAGDFQFQDGWNYTASFGTSYIVDINDGNVMAMGNNGNTY